MKDIINELKRYRFESGMTICELSKKSGVSKNTIVNVEKGHTVPRIDILQKLGAALNVDLLHHSMKQECLPYPILENDQLAEDVRLLQKLYDAYQGCDKKLIKKDLAMHLKMLCEEIAGLLIV